MPGRRAGAEQRHAAAARLDRAVELRRDPRQRVVVAEVGAELHGEVALRQRGENPGDLAIAGALADLRAEQFGHHDDGIGDQARGDAGRHEMSERAPVAHRHGVGRRQLRQHFRAQPGVAFVEADAADAGVDDAGELRELLARCRVWRVRRLCRQVQHRLRPCEPLRRSRVEPGDRRLNLVGRQQHDRRLPGAAGQDFAADMHERRASIAEFGDHPGERSDEMPAAGPQVALREACEQQLPAGQQRCRDMREQQVAEVVTVEGAEQDDRQGGRARHARAPINRRRPPGSGP